MKKTTKTILKILVSIALIAIIFATQVSISEVVVNFKKLNLLYVPLIVILLVLNYVISSIRWKKLLIFENCDDVSISYLTRLYFIGAFFNNFMVTSIGGDVYKIFKLGQKIKSKSNAFSATFMERFTGIIALVLIAYIGLISNLQQWLTFLPETVSQNRNLTYLVEFLLFFGFWIATGFAFISLKFSAKKIKKIQSVYESLVMYKNKNSVMLWALLTSFVVQLIAIFTQFFIFKALGIDLPLLYSLLVLPVITIVSFFVPSLNGVGVQDFLYIQLFSFVGVSQTMAVLASIIYHLFRLFVSLLGGVFYAFNKDI